MKDEKIIRLVTIYTCYTLHYDRNPESEESDRNYDLLWEGLNQIDPDRADQLSDILCRVDKNNQITYERNLRDFLLSI